MASKQGQFFVFVVLSSLCFVGICLTVPILHNGSETRPSPNRHQGTGRFRQHSYSRNNSHNERILGPPSNKRLVDGLLKTKDESRKLLRSELYPLGKNRKSHRVRTGASAGGSKNPANCSHNAFIGCLNLGNPFDISDLIAAINTNDFASGAGPDKGVLFGKLSKVCAATEPIVNCLSKAACLDSSATNEAPVWKSVFAGAQPNQARLLPNWVKSLRYLPTACDMLLGRNGSRTNANQETRSKPSAPLTFDFKSLEKCPELTESLYREECGVSNANPDTETTDLIGIVQDPWKTPATFLSTATLQWIDFQFLEMLKADLQVNFSALPVISESTCLYLNRKVDCFIVQVYRYCDGSVQDSIISSLLKFINFQLLISDSRCDLLSETASDFRRVLSVNANTQNMKSLSFVNGALDKKEETFPVERNFSRPIALLPEATAPMPQEINVTLALPFLPTSSTPAMVQITQVNKIRDEVSSLVNNFSTTNYCSNLSTSLTFCIVASFLPYYR